MNIQKTNRKTQLRRSSRSAFTLIELLLVISIIAVLGTLAVGLIGSAQVDARVAASRARATLIQKAMEVEMEDYEVRRSPLPFTTIGALTAAVPSTIWTDSAPGDKNFLLHAKNLKRMLTIDLIRSEFPTNRIGKPYDSATNAPVGLGVFPSPAMSEYLVNDLLLNPTAPAFQLLARAQPANVVRWASFRGFDKTPAEQNPLTEENIQQRFVDASEMLYAIISVIEYDGTSVIDSLGTAAIADNDGDGVLEVIDAFGDPMRFEFHQRNIVPEEFNPPTSAPRPFAGPFTGVWALEVLPNPEADMTTFDDFVPVQSTDLVKPVLPTDLRFFVTSEKLFEIDGNPLDLK